MPFIRVRGATIGDPLSEFDAPAREVAARPELYKVVDPEPVAAPRPPLHVPGVVQPKVPKRAPKKTSGGTSKSPAPAGATPKEKA